MRRPVSDGMPYAPNDCFPLLTYNAEPSPVFPSLVSHLSDSGKTISIEKVPYEFQRGGNMMMRISSDP